MKTFLNTMISGLCTILWIVLMLGFSDVKIAISTLLAAVIHELGHMAVLFILGKDFSFPRAVASGFRIKTSVKLSYKEEVAVAIGGPLSNIVLFLFFITPFPEFAIINLITALSNLLPMKDFDGYRILSASLSLFGSASISDKIMPHVTVFFSSLLVFFSLFTIMISNGGYWIFFIFFIVLIKEILFLQKHTFFEH